MSDTRKKGLEYFQKKFGHKPSEFVSVSRLFPPEKSWTGRKTWWFDLPVKRIRANEKKYYYLLGAKTEKKASFVIVKIPNKFLIKNRKRFETGYNGMIRLHLAAYKKNWLVDERGKGRVSFSRFQKDC